MSAERQEQRPSRAESRRLMRWLLGYSWPYRWSMLGILLLTVVTGLTMNYPPVLIRNAVDRWLAVSGISVDARLLGLLRTATLYFAISAGSLLLRYAQTLVTAWLGQRIIRDIRRDVFDKALKLPLRFYDRTPVGRLLTRVTSDVDSVQSFVSDGVVGAIADVFQMVGVFVFMLVISPVLLAALVSIIPFLVVTFLFSNTRVRAANREIRRAQSALNTQAQEAISGMSTIQLFGREQTIRSRFSRLNRLMRDACFLEVRWFSFYFPVLELAQAISTVLVLGVGGFCVLHGWGGVTLGVVIAFLTYVRDFFRPLDGLSNRAGMLQQALAACERIYQLFQEEEEISDPLQPALLPPTPQNIAFERVDFAYLADTPVLYEVSFTIAPGEIVAVVGATGSGKTTLVNLLMRFYAPTAGGIRLGAHDLRDLRQEELRRHFGTVRQEPFIFSATVAENIALMNPATSREDIIVAAQQANADAFIRRLEQGYDTKLRERGAGLSAGQKQLLALARIMLQREARVLILDEATANVDSETEGWIQDALKTVMVGRTGIIIAHRLSTIRHADRILVFQQGRLVAQGRHEDLLRQGGYYRRLYEYLAMTENSG